MPPVQAVKFNNWNIPFDNRADTFNLQLRGASIQPFRTDGGLSVFGSRRRPTAEKTHSVTFNLQDTGQSICGPSFNQSASPKFQAMMEALLDGQGRLWFDTFRKSGPSVFSLADLNEVIVTPNHDDWTRALITVEWQIYNPILYRPLNSGYMTAAGYTPVTVADAVFGESGDERVFASFTVSSDPTTFTIVNEGHFRTSNIIIRIESLGAGGYVNPRIDNLTTEQWISFARTGSTSSHVIQAKCTLGPHRVRESSDGGASFVDSPSSGNIWTSTTIDDHQVPLMELIPGSNSMQVTGVTNSRVMFLWLPAYGMI